MSKPVIELRDVAVRYRLAKHRVASFKEFAIHWMRGALSYQELWALRGVSLEIERGATVGIVGRNGAGKSTMLKVMSRILKPQKGRATIRGTVAPILELGTGFDHELSGLENLRLNALLLGQSNKAIDDKRDEIVEFSELGDFIHSPIRSYSSGMLARLGFAIASSFDPDILILDEVLSVGDTGFQRKCEQRLAELRSRGSTILMVSHGAAISDYCDRCIWLDQGLIRADGPSHEVLGEYLDQFQSPSAPMTTGRQPTIAEAPAT
jgi:ABC-2 type transport system ATP-binding protein/lipopolysaccharide transport system ATP-binding protein